MPEVIVSPNNPRSTEWIKNLTSNTTSLIIPEKNTNSDEGADFTVHLW